MQNPVINVIIHAVVHLCDYMDENIIKNCYKVVPKFFSALEEAIFFDVLEDKQLLTVKKVMEICNPDISESLIKVNNIKEAIILTRNYQQEKQAAALTSKKMFESSEDIDSALNYLNHLILCLEFYPIQECLLEEIFLKLIKTLEREEEVTAIFVKLFKSPHNVYKIRLLKALVFFIINCLVIRPKIEYKHLKFS